MKAHFIIFYKDQNSLSKCLGCIEALEVPENVETDVLGVDEGNSIIEAYEACREGSDADLKIYIRENVYITDTGFLRKTVSFMENHPEVGLAGIVGGSMLKKGFYDWTCGSVNVFNEDRRTRFVSESDGDFSYVEALSGQILVAARDVPWTVKADDEFSSNPDRFFDIFYSRKIAKTGAKLAVINFPENPPALWEYGKAFKERYDVYTEDKGAWVRISEETPLVSVAVTVYNAADFVRDTMDSVLKQTYQNLELIVSDDFSSDNSVEILREYEKKDARVTVLTTDRNRHACYAENRCFDMAKGKYFCMLGHDDMWRPWKVEEQVSFMEHEPDYEMCFSHCHIIDDKIEIHDENNMYSVFRQGNHSRKYWIRTLFMDGNALCAASAMIRRESVCPPLNRLSNIQVQDYELWLKLLRKGPLYIMKDCIVFYRQFTERENLSDMDDSSDSNGKTWRMIMEMQYFKYKFVMSLSKEELYEYFGKEIGAYEVKDDLELLVVKAWFLFLTRNRHFQDLFDEIFENPGGLEAMERVLNLSLPDYYEMEMKTGY